MIIANYLEYIYAVRELFDSQVWESASKYVREAEVNKFKDNKERIDLRSAIAALQLEIMQLRNEMRNVSDKKAAGLKFAEVKKKKQELVVKLKALTDNDRFNKLNNDVKSCVCASYLLQKYLTSELSLSAELVKGKLSSDTFILNTEKFRDSVFFQEAVHICDFVAAYVERYPHKVKTPGHFKTLLNQGARWNDLYLKADEYFARWREEDIADPDAIVLVQKSKEGVSVVKTYPESGLQVVRLLTPEALDYEGKRMGHCVGSGSYDASLESGSSQFYSLRDVTDGEWRPHVTIQFSDGKIKQIKGRKDRMVISRYINETRDFAADLLGCQGLDGIESSKISDWKNIGYFRNADGKLCDVYDSEQQNTIFDTLEMYGEDFRKIKDIGGVSVGTLILKGEVDQGVLNKIAQLKCLKRLEVKDAKFLGIKVLDFSKIFWEGVGEFKTDLHNDFIISLPTGIGMAEFKESKGSVIDLSSQNLQGIEEVIFNENIDEIHFGKSSDEILRNIDFSKYKKLRTLCISDVHIDKSDFFADLKGLEQLSLAKVGFSDFPRFVLSDFDNLKKVDLSDLDLSGVEVLDFDVPNVDELVLSMVDLGKDREFVFEKNKSIKALDLCYVKANLTRLKLPDSLETVYVQDNGDFSSLLHFENCRNMKKVTLGWGVNLHGLGLEERFPEGVEEFFSMHVEDSLASKVDFRRFEKFKKFDIVRWIIPAVKEIYFPESMENLQILDGKAESLEVLDLGRNSKVEDVVLSLHSVPKLRKLVLGKNTKKLNLMGTELGKVEVLDLGHCDKLSDLHFQSCKFPKLKKLILPSQVVNFAQMSGNECPNNVEISVAKNVNPEFLKTVIRNFGNNIVYRPEKPLLPVLFNAKASSQTL